jgi:hypothetical protein
MKSLGRRFGKVLPKPSKTYLNSRLWILVGWASGSAFKVYGWL